MQSDVAFLAFNRGLVSRFALARTDIKRLAMSADTMTNWIPMVLGPMYIRPGMQYMGTTKSNQYARYLPFVFSVEDTAILQLTDGSLRVRTDSGVITRPAVTCAVTNGNFTTDLTGWTDVDETGATSDWQGGGYVGFVGTKTTYAARYQKVTLVESGVEHALRIVVARGKITLKVGANNDTDEYIKSTTLGEGTHSLAFTPTTDFYIQFKAYAQNIALLSQCTIEGSGTMEVPTPWDEDDLENIRYEQSADVVYVGCKDKQQYKIERRATNSWSVVKYQPDDGPFRLENVLPATITPSVLTGNGSLAASQGIFDSDHVGALFSLTSIGQIVESSLSAQNTFTDYIRVEGSTRADPSKNVGDTNNLNDRLFTIDISGTFSGTITLQRSYGAPGSWVDVGGETFTTTTNTTYEDKFENQLIFYRIGIKTGGYTSGTAVCRLTYESGSRRGVVRITSYTDNQNVGMEVLDDLGGLDATAVWEESVWSEKRGFPNVPKLHDGRLFWLGKDKIVGSVSDGYESFDHLIDGDSAPVQRSFGRGPVDTIMWALSLTRMVVGGQANVYVCKSSALDEPITPTNFSIKAPSGQGSANVNAVDVNGQAIFVQRGGMRVMSAGLDASVAEYVVENLSALVPEIGEPQIVRMGVQTQPDTRIHCVRSDGTVALLVFDPLENVRSWCEIETDGLVEDVCVLPSQAGEYEDHVYYIVKRTINGSTVRYLEKMAHQVDCRGGAANYLADSYVEYNSTATTTITGLDHLEGEQVVVWADSADVGTDTDGTLIYTVSGGQITLATEASHVIVGLPYTAQWRSGKLSQITDQTKQSNANNKNNKNIKGFGLILADTHYQGLQYGRDFDNLDDMPSMEEGAVVAADTIHTSYDGDPLVFPGTWGIDERLCLQAKAPRPATVLAAVCDIEHHG